MCDAIAIADSVSQSDDVALYYRHPATFKFYTFSSSHSLTHSFHELKKEILWVDANDDDYAMMQQLISFGVNVKFCT